MSDPNLVPCPACGERVSRDAYTCRNCGHRIRLIPLGSVAIWSICILGIAVCGALVLFILDSIRR
jgi:hypothetical protein